MGLACWETMAAAPAEGDILVVVKMVAPPGMVTLEADIICVAAAVVGSKDCALVPAMHQSSPRTLEEGPAVGVVGFVLR